LEYVEGQNVLIEFQIGATGTTATALSLTVGQVSGRLVPPGRISGVWRLPFDVAA
jgi:hypothetical protein